MIEYKILEYSGAEITFQMSLKHLADRPAREYFELLPYPRHGFPAEKAEGKGGGGLLPPEFVEKKLSADEKAKYDAILADYEKAMKEAAGDKEKMAAARKDAHKKVLKIITPEHLAELPR